MPEPSASQWVRRFLPLLARDGLVLDLAAGRGRHTRLLLDAGFRVRAVDREIGALRTLAGSRCVVDELDLEEASGWRLGGDYDGVVVTNYLYRPLFPDIAAAVAPGGVLIYETFAQGNERFGSPRNPDFLLRPGELLEAFGELTIVAFEQGLVAHPRPAIVQRIAARARPADLSASLPVSANYGERA